MNLHNREALFLFVACPFALTIGSQSLIDRFRLCQRVDMQVVAYKWTSSVRYAHCVVVALFFLRVNDTFWRVGINLDIIIAAILPLCLFCATCLRRTRIIHPAIPFIRFVDMTESQVINAFAQWLKLCQGW